MEEKFKDRSLKRKRSDSGTESSDSSDSSSSEDEDEQGELATEALDSEIAATLKAIQSKDPRVYDKKSTFYTQPVENGEASGLRKAAEKPMFLRDYHRQNLLNGDGEGEEDAGEPLSYNQEQEALKRSVIREFNATGQDSPQNGEASEEDDFLVAKPKKAPKSAAKPAEITTLDIESADRDPEGYLSNFMAARAWIPTGEDQAHPFESDDEEEDEKAEEFEQAYNFRFEDPEKSNEKLVSHARDMAAKYSVRREEKNPRQKQRDAEREKKDLAKRERAEEKARLRKLKIEEAESKVRKVKKAAGFGQGSELSPEELAEFIEADWDDAGWEKEMQKRFGDAYYAQEDVISDEDETGSRKRKRPKKPRWNDDIDINDIVPDFEEENPEVELSDTADVPSASVPSSKKARRSKKSARIERQMVESIVDSRLELDSALEPGNTSRSAFNYRQTSPVSFGLSSRDILLADDRDLNKYAGLKKLASFRDEKKRQRDRRALGKKARLRQWRKDTFGNENGPAEAVDRGEPLGDAGQTEVMNGAPNAEEAVKKKRKRSKGKAKETIAGEA